MLLPKDHIRKNESIKSFVDACSMNICIALRLPIMEINGCKYCESGIDGALLNGVYYCNLAVKDVDSTVEIIESYFEKRGLAHSWWVDSEKEPPALRDALTKKGLNCIGVFPGLGLDPRQAVKPSEALKDYVVELVQDDRTLGEWSDVLAASFNFSEEVGQGYFSLIRKAGLSGSFKHFVGKYKGKVVSTGSILCTDQGGYIYNMSTAEKVRRRGYAKAVCYAMLEFAKSENMNRVALQSSPMASTLSPKLGFKVYNTFHIYA